MNWNAIARRFQNKPNEIKCFSLFSLRLRVAQLDQLIVAIECRATLFTSSTSCSFRSFASVLRFCVSRSIGFPWVAHCFEYLSNSRRLSKYCHVVLVDVLLFSITSIYLADVTLSLETNGMSVSWIGSHHAIFNTIFLHFLFFFFGFNFCRFLFGFSCSVWFDDCKTE